jgi:hypothetical protein
MDSFGPNRRPGQSWIAGLGVKHHLISGETVLRSFHSLNFRSVNTHKIGYQFPLYVISDENNHAPKTGCRLVVLFQ